VACVLIRHSRSECIVKQRARTGERGERRQDRQLDRVTRRLERRNTGQRNFSRCDKVSSNPKTRKVTMPEDKKKKVEVRDQEPAKDPKGGRHSHKPQGGGASSGGNTGGGGGGSSPGNPPHYIP
ncbi:MAG: hypothetical protein ABJB69_09960, partial [Spartobacteria bacterium]